MVGRSGMTGLPGPLRLTSTFPFVGRSAELERLRALMPRAEGDGSRVVLLGGEPGSGKSRLVREFAAEAADDGALVLYGACDAEVRTPYGAFVDALDQLARETDTDELRFGPGGRRRRAHPPAPRAGRPDRRSPARGRGRPGHRAPPPPHGGGRAAGRRHAAAAGAARARGRALGRRSHAAAAASPRARGKRPCAAAGHLPRHRGATCRSRCRSCWPTCAATTSSG